MTRQLYEIYSFEFAETCTKEYSEEQIKTIKEHVRWLKEMLPHHLYKQ